MGRIHNLIEKGDIGGVKEILAKSPSAVNEQLSKTEFDQPLHIAAWQNAAEITSILVAAGANIDTRGDKGWTALHYAAQYGSVEVTNILIAAGANLNLKDDMGHTALLRAVRGRVHSCLEVARLLRGAGADADLNCLVSLGENETVCELLKNNNRPFHETIEPASLLEDAIILISSKVEIGASLQTQEAIINHYKDMLLALLGAGANINAIGSTGEPALFVAIQNNIVPLARLLLEQGADINLRLLNYGQPINAMTLTSGNEGREMRQLVKEFGFTKE